MTSIDHNRRGSGSEVLLEQTPSPDWIDRLVELHVLAEHGDHDAAVAADRWMATDAHARRIWEEVERGCTQLRTGWATPQPLLGAERRA